MLEFPNEISGKNQTLPCYVFTCVVFMFHSAICWWPWVLCVHFWITSFTNSKEKEKKNNERIISIWTTKGHSFCNARKHDQLWQRWQIDAPFFISFHSTFIAGNSLLSLVQIYCWAHFERHPSVIYGNHKYASDQKWISSNVLTK